jgi:hypothetical protein
MFIYTYIIFYFKIIIYTFMHREYGFFFTRKYEFIIVCTYENNSVTLKQNLLS